MPIAEIAPAAVVSPACIPLAVDSCPDLKSKMNGSESDERAEGKDLQRGPPNAGMDSTSMTEFGDVHSGT
ncbi:hypothetical protein L210DRAFT_3580237 [Boletus edulis BED1]|uniref:Uncharacterized protein n=1 Tax=Boletus edulis BED1 TaxID=1328754 RepID=A0AAD4BBL2_BOLED|nr:hypothetical protein L210DRAFT_3580237 [Boletus edulis BED1]